MGEENDKSGGVKAMAEDGAEVSSTAGEGHGQAGEKAGRNRSQECTGQGADAMDSTTLVGTAI